MTKSVLSTLSRLSFSLLVMKILKLTTARQKIGGLHSVCRFDVYIAYNNAENFRQNFWMAACMKTTAFCFPVLI